MPAQSGGGRHGEELLAGGRMHYPDGVSDMSRVGSVDDVVDPRGDLEWGTIAGLVDDAAARFAGKRALCRAIRF